MANRITKLVRMISKTKLTKLMDEIEIMMRIIMATINNDNGSKIAHEMNNSCRYTSNLRNVNNEKLLNNCE